MFEYVHLLQNTDFSDLVFLCFLLHYSLDIQWNVWKGQYQTDLILSIQGRIWLWEQMYQKSVLYTEISSKLAMFDGSCSRYCSQFLYSGLGGPMIISSKTDMKQKILPRHFYLLCIVLNLNIVIQRVLSPLLESGQDVNFRLGVLFFFISPNKIITGPRKIAKLKFQFLVSKLNKFHL